MAKCWMLWVVANANSVSKLNFLSIWQVSSSSLATHQIILCWQFSCFVHSIILSYRHVCGAIQNWTAFSCNTTIALERTQQWRMFEWKNLNLINLRLVIVNWIQFDLAKISHVRFCLATAIKASEEQWYNYIIMQSQ